jgi:hypothetical protein
MHLQTKMHADQVKIGKKPPSVDANCDTLIMMIHFGYHKTPYGNIVPTSHRVSNVEQAMNSFENDALRLVPGAAGEAPVQGVPRGKKNFITHEWWQYIEKNLCFEWIANDAVEKPVLEMVLHLITWIVLLINRSFSRSYLDDFAGSFGARFGRFGKRHSGVWTSDQPHRCGRYTFRRQHLGLHTASKGECCERWRRKRCDRRHDYTFRRPRRGWRASVERSVGRSTACKGDRWRRPRR